MAAKGDPRVLRHLVTYLRTEAGLSQTAFGQAAEVNQADVSRYELGREAPPEKSLRRMAGVPDVPWPLLVHLRRFHTALAAALDRWRAGAGKGTRGESVERAILGPVLLAVAPYLVAGAAAEARPQTLDEERREAEEVWAALERFPMSRRRRLLELSPRTSLTQALIERVRQASEGAASHRPEEALELADLALFIAERVPGDSGGRVT